MNILLTSDYSLHVATADGAHVYEGKAGDTIKVPQDIAELIIAAGAGSAVKAAEKAVKAKGETATK